MTITQARAAQRDNRRKMKTASPAVHAICEKLDALYADLIEAMMREART